MNARMLLNPTAGRGRGRRSLAAVAGAARRHGIEVEVPESPAALTACARRAASEGVERLLPALPNFIVSVDAVARRIVVSPPEGLPTEPIEPG